MILFVLAFSTYFLMANKQQALGKRILEKTPGFRFTY